MVRAIGPREKSLPVWRLEGVALCPALWHGPCSTGAGWTWRVRTQRERDRGLTIRISTEAGQTTTIRIEGQLTVADLPDVREACESASPPLRLDLSGLRSADLDGIRALRSLSETAELHGASPYIRQLLLEADE